MSRTEKIRKAQREYMRRYRAKNPEKIREYAKKWREENPEKVKASRERYLENLAERYEQEGMT